MATIAGCMTNDHSTSSSVNTTVRSKWFPTVLVPTLPRMSVPKLFHEPHVETGFRQTGQPWCYYLCSLFQVHNECMNCWTHLLALILVTVRIWHFSLERDMLYDPYMWPLGAGLLTIVLLYLCSSGAHCFSNRSEMVHYTCFMIDYAGIGLYGLGSGIIHYWYCLHEDMFGCFPHRFAAPMGILLSSLVCACCSISKTRYTRPYPFTRRLWQIGSVLSIYGWLIFPILHKIYLCIWFSFWEPSLTDHLEQMLWFVLGGFFFGSDIPQRFFPGLFDFIGHSHQIFHLCILMTSYKQLDAVYQDIITDEKELYAGEPPTFYNTYGAVLLGLIINFFIVLRFRQEARQKIDYEINQITKEQ